MILYKVNKLGGVEIEHQVMGTKIVGKRFVQIDLSPEEIIDFLEDDRDGDFLYRYLVSLTKHYKRND